MGQTLSNPVTEKKKEYKDNENVRCSVAAIQGWRTTMEDSHCMELKFSDKHPNWSFFGVFDGHAGSVASKYSSDHLFKKIVEKFEEYEKNKINKEITSEYNGLDQNLTEEMRYLAFAIHDGFIEFDEKMKNDEMFKDDPIICGTTALVLVITDTHYIFANCGDSRGVFCRDDKLFFQTKDHKPGDEIERNRIIEAGGSVLIERVNGNLAVSRSLGDFSFKTNNTRLLIEQCVSPEPTMTIIQRNSDDQFVVLACDGVWDVLTSNQVVDLIINRLQVIEDYSEICDIIIDTCLYLDSRDNMTCMLILLPTCHTINPSAVNREREIEERLRADVIKACNQNDSDLSPSSIIKNLKSDYSKDDDLFIYYKIGFINKILDEHAPNRDKSQDFSHPFGLRNIPHTLRLIHTDAIKHTLDIDATNNTDG